MAMSTPFRNRNNAPVPLYSWDVIAGGIGFVVYYGCKANDGGDYFLTPSSSVGSGPKMTNNTLPGNGSWVNMTEVNFDLEFEKTTVIEGPCVVSIPWVLKFDSGTDNIRFACKIYHYDGSTETDISGGGDTSNENSATTSTVDTYVGLGTAVKLDLTRQVFKKGEILRVEVIGAGKGAVGGSDNQWMGHNPVGDTEGEWFTELPTFSSRMTVILPFKIDP